VSIAVYDTSRCPSSKPGGCPPDQVTLELDGSAVARWHDGRPDRKFPLQIDLEVEYGIDVVATGRCIRPWRGGRNHLALHISDTPPPGYRDPEED